MPVNILIDYKDLEYFITTKKLMPRQAKWAGFLLEFNFMVKYQSSKKNNKADALTRMPNKQPTGNDNKSRKYQMQMLLPPDCIDMQLTKITNQHKEESEKNQNLAKNLKDQSLAEKYAKNRSLAEKNTENWDLGENLKDLLTLPDWMKELN